MVFHALKEKVPSSLNEGRISSNNDGFLNYFIKMKDCIALLKQRGLCELSEIAETFSIVYLTVFRLFIYLMYENTGAVDD